MTLVDPSGADNDGVASIAYNPSPACRWSSSPEELHLQALTQRYESLDSYRSYRSAIPGQVIAQWTKSDGCCCAMRQTQAFRRLYFRRAHLCNG